MPVGHCFCGKIRIEYTGEVKLTAQCHCENCRHYTGALYSHNIRVSSDGFEVTGSPKEVTVIAASGKSITNCFCGDCGTPLFRYGDAFGGIGGDRIVQAGILDDLNELSATKPILEMFTEARVDWVHSLKDEGVNQFEGMPPAPPRE
ncbi:Mss4-like protein [Xylogone sp. PMI_703]|nr:Mss4-like protein [Xylogone sp. PMI_703]